MTDANLESYLKGCFGTVIGAFFTLYSSISGGVSWRELMIPFIKANTVESFAAVVFFCSFIFVVIFGVLNIVASIFIESAMRFTMSNREFLVEQKRLTKKTTRAHLEELFNLIDEKQEGRLSVAELAAVAGDSRITDFLEALDIDAPDFVKLYALLDEEGSGSIDFDQFCERCLRLQGHATSFDLFSLIHDFEVFVEYLEGHMKSIKYDFMCIDEGIRKSQMP